MNTINLGNFRLDFQPTYIKLKINEGCHFDAKAFEELHSIKEEIYGNLKVGILICNDTEADYSIDPLVLVHYKEILENYLQWVIVVSNIVPDFKNFEYLQRLTKVPCKFVRNYKNLHPESCIAS